MSHGQLEAASEQLMAHLVSSLGRDLAVEEVLSLGLETLLLRGAYADSGWDAGELLSSKLEAALGHFWLDELKVMTDCLASATDAEVSEALSAAEAEIKSSKQ